MADNKLNDMIHTALSNIEELADTNTVIGEKIDLGNGTVVIPVSKVSVGFVSGGMEYLSKHDKQQNPHDNNFGGGGGTGISVTPVGFLISQENGKVEFLPVTVQEPAAQNVVDSVGAILEKSPDILEKLKGVFSHKGKKKPAAEETAATPTETEMTEG